MIAERRRLQHLSSTQLLSVSTSVLAIPNNHDILIVDRADLGFRGGNWCWLACNLWFGWGGTCTCAIALFLVPASSCPRACLAHVSNALGQATEGQNEPKGT